MSKVTGIGNYLFIDGYDVSGDVGAIQGLKKSLGEQDVTGLTVGAHERLLLLEDGEINFANYFNAETVAANIIGIHTILKTLPTTDRLASWFISATRGATTGSLIAKQMNYDLQRGSDGALNGGPINLKGSGYGLEYGVALTAGKESVVAAGALASVDSGLVGGSANGLSVFVHILAIVGTATKDINVIIESSSDDAVGDPYATIAETGEINQPQAPYAVRLSVAGSIERYLRIRVATVDGFTSAIIAVAANRG